MLDVTERRKRFKQALTSGPIFVAHGCVDGLTARLVERAGGAAVHASGSALHRSYGYPDMGLLTLVEMVDRTTAMADAASIPVIADGETGFGGDLNTARTVREFERTGAVALHIEDSMMPKRPAHLGFTSSSITRQEYLDKIRAALDARTDESFMIVARTGVDLELQEKIERLQECIELGADAFFNSERDKAGTTALCKALKKPGMGVLTAGMTVEEYAACGMKCGIIPGGLAIAALVAQFAFVKDVLRTGNAANYFRGLEHHDELREFYMKQGMENVK